MSTSLHEKIFDHLNLSKDKVLDEIALLSAHQKLSEFNMESEYFTKKYNEAFESFDNRVNTSEASYDLENDWMAWKFAEEGITYWTSLLKDVKK